MVTHSLQTLHASLEKAVALETTQAHDIPGDSHALTAVLVLPTGELLSSAFSESLDTALGRDTVFTLAGTVSQMWRTYHPEPGEERPGPAKQLIDGDGDGKIGDEADAKDLEGDDLSQAFDSVLGHTLCRPIYLPHEKTSSDTPATKDATSSDDTLATKDASNDGTQATKDTTTADTAPPKKGATPKSEPERRVPIFLLGFCSLDVDLDTLREEAKAVDAYLQTIMGDIGPAAVNLRSRTPPPVIPSRRPARGGVNDRP